MRNNHIMVIACYVPITLMINAGLLNLVSLNVTVQSISSKSKLKAMTCESKSTYSNDQILHALICQIVG